MSKLGSIIYIDDDPEECALFEEAYEFIKSSLGINNELLLFTHPAEFIAYSRELSTEPALIICDLAMPIINGIELRREVLQSQGVNKTPFVIYSTSEPDPNTLFKLSKLDIDGLMIKSRSYDKMVENIKTIISYWLTGENYKNDVVSL